MSAGEIGEQPTGFGEDCCVAVAAGVMAGGLSDECFADTDGAVEDDRFTGAQESECGEVSDCGGGD